MLGGSRSRYCSSSAASAPLRLNVFDVNQVSIIIPVLNEALGIQQALEALLPLRARGHEVIVVDGGSADDTLQRALPLADRVLSAPRGRASQMNAGAQLAGGDILLFLHVDTHLPEAADRLILEGLQGATEQWGRFDVRIAGAHPLLRAVATTMNLRSRLSGICTGDQAIFVRRELFRHCDGFPDLALMEDIALCRMLRAISPPLCIAQPALTSARRWEARGVLRTVVLMWWLRLRYFLGASPSRLARIYDAERG